MREYIRAAAREKSSPCSLSDHLEAPPSSGPAAEESTHNVCKRPAAQQTEGTPCKKAKRLPYVRRKIVPAAPLLAYNCHFAAEE